MIIKFNLIVFLICLVCLIYIDKMYYKIGNNLKVIDYFTINKHKKILLSYPRSGNHLCRFFIELLSELPTFGCETNNKDIEIYKNNFKEKLPFNIKNYDKNNCYHKYHEPNISNNIDNLILIIRNPREVLLRNNNYKLNYNDFQRYFNNIDYYNTCKGDKLILFYEDILTDKKGFINKLYNYLALNNPNKKKYIMNNIDKLFTISLNGKNRAWGGNVSNTEISYYYKKIPNNIKGEFDNYLANKLIHYPFLKKKYNI
jgi:hypothetical protein